MKKILRRYLKGSAQDNRKALDTIFNKLEEGVVFGFLYNYRPDHPSRPKVKEGFWVCMHRHPFKPVIYWDCFGSSAISADKKKLNWCIRNMFGLTPYQFLHSYTERELGYKFINRKLTQEEWKLIPRKSLHLNWRY